MTDHYLWILSQFGILLEVAGALYIAVSAISLHERIGRLFVDIWGFTEIPRIVSMMQNQTKSDMRGFLLLAGGLLLQFVGNFGAL